MFHFFLQFYIILFYLTLVGATVFIIYWQLQIRGQASTRVRKTFHFLIVLVYVPGILYECAFLYIASGVALALMVVFDLLRILRMPPFGTILQDAFHTFADEKDSGLIAFTPFCLLIGCSLPMWLLPCPCYHDSSGINPKLLPLFSGILTIGFGDTAASIIGSKFGHTKWKSKFLQIHSLNTFVFTYIFLFLIFVDSSRTFEGSIAYIVAALMPIFVLCYFNFVFITTAQCLIVIIGTVITCLIEAHTDQVDNLVLPLVFYIIVSLV